MYEVRVPKNVIIAPNIITNKANLLPILMIKTVRDPTHMINMPLKKIILLKNLLPNAANADVVFGI